MSWRIVVASQKGGVGKTTVCLNLALACAERGVRTLLVDLDPQGGIGHSLAKNDGELRGLADLIAGECTPAQAVVQTKNGNLSFLPRGRLHPRDVPDFERALDTEPFLRGALEAIEDGLDLVILDTPSGLGMPTRAALRSGDFALLPLQAEPLAVRTLSQVMAVIDHVRTHENPELQLLGILPTMADREKDASLAALVEVWSGFGCVLDTVIPRHDVFLEASQRGVPIGYLGGKISHEARRFNVLADEVVGLIQHLAGEGVQDAERPARQLL